LEDFCVLLHRIHEVC